MEGNEEKKCDFGQNCKNKALNTLTNCSKLTMNHLRYLKSNLKELEILKIIYLNRAGINQGMSMGKGMESANNDARKWPIIPFDVSRDFIISKDILV